MTDDAPPSDPASRDDACAEALAAVADVQGWMTPDQARRLWARARATRSGQRIVEIGSYQGRSAIVLARAAPAGVEIVAIDPHAGNDRGPREIHGTADEGRGDHEAFLANLAAAGVRDQVRHVRKPSSEALGEVADPIDVLYIDGAHRFGPARDDIRDWGHRVADGGTLLIHDSFSSIGVTLAILDQLVFSKAFRYVGRSTSMAEYRREPVRGRERVKSTVRQSAQLPWFVRNVLIKVLITLHLTPATRLLGHRSGDWPY
ncbi:MAG: class I SAM-dependent methyltransferase [Acidimicrobiia bacterium]|jgi:predicted O-methyltransferase YrrM|nr:class I SAM-dependent methyltransferase [Acidimicrobiia bacterium]